jgi:PPOX class probable F420-dependent enzyme
MIDQSTQFGRRVAEHLREDPVVWLTTVTPRGAPLPSPVWFLWDGADGVLVYSMPSARVRNIEANPRVSLNFAGNGQGGDIVVLSGTASVDPAVPGVADNEAYLARYGERIERMGLSPVGFGERYSVGVRIRLTGVRGH